MSRPISRMASTENCVGGWPSKAPRPAEMTRNSPRFLTAWRKSPSAIGLRQTLPVHRNKIVFIKNRADKGDWLEGSRQSEITEPSLAVPSLRGRFQLDYWQILTRCRS